MINLFFISILFTVLLAALKIWVFFQIPLFVIFIPIILYCLFVVVVFVVIAIVGIYLFKKGMKKLKETINFIKSIGA